MLSYLIFEFRVTCQASDDTHCKSYQINAFGEPFYDFESEVNEFLFDEFFLDIFTLNGGLPQGEKCIFSTF